MATATRNLKETPTQVILIYHGIFGLIIIWIYIWIEAAITDELRFNDYTLRMWLISAGAACISATETLLTTVAFQKDRAGFSSLLTYL